MVAATGFRSYLTGIFLLFANCESKSDESNHLFATQRTVSFSQFELARLSLHLEKFVDFNRQKRKIRASLRTNVIRFDG
jgi:hypothetical protein